MATASSIIDRAYSLIGYKAAGEPLSGDDAQYGLSALNDMLDLWNTQRLFIYTLSEVVANVSGPSITIGPGMAINTPRPVAMEEGSFARINGLDYPITWLSDAQYFAIPTKTIAGAIPEFGYYDGGNPTGTISLWPYPTTLTNLHLLVRSQLSAFADLSTDVPLPQGYKLALQYSLAEELAPGVRELPPQVAKKAALARRAIRQLNVAVPLLEIGASTGSPLARFISGS